MPRRPDICYSAVLHDTIFAFHGYRFTAIENITNIALQLFGCFSALEST